MYYVKKRLEIKEMLIRLNTLKGREVWRPLAPAVLYDYQKNILIIKSSHLI